MPASVARQRKLVGLLAVVAAAIVLLAAILAMNWYFTRPGSLDGARAPISAALGASQLPGAAW